MSAAHSTGTVFESFNARSLAPEQVAETFIPPTQFSDLATRSHCTVVGPRGSGKTSMLKMLQPSALESWRSAEADIYRSRIDYTGVFIPTDISWSKQTLAIVEGLQPNIATVIRGAAFTTHVLHELLDVIEWRSQPAPQNSVAFRRVVLPGVKEKMIVRELAKAWMLQPATETFLGLKHSLSGRLVQIWSFAQRLTLLGSAAQEIPDWLTLDFLSCTRQAVELFDDSVGQKNARWALLFDELELAPDWLMKGLLTALRSTDQKLLFKLSVSPFNERHEAIRNAVQAMPDQDYKEIRLWHANKEEGYDFSRKLFLSICQGYGFYGNLDDVFSKSFFEAETTSAYRKGSRNYRVLARGLRQDPSFANFWSRTGLRLDDIAGLPEEERAAKVRKIYPLVLVRSFFRVAVGSRMAEQQLRRSRKTLELYSGSTSLLTIAEANPRWIIGLSRLLLSEATSTPINRGKQAEQLEATIHKFRATLKTITLGQSSAGLRAKTLLGLIDEIGQYFQKSVLLDDFHPQPTLTFTVDSHASTELVNAIGRAVNAGALMYVPDKSSLGIMNDVRGKRFRISYLLAPYYRLPLRLGASVSLSHILSSKGGSHSLQGELLSAEVK